jgi:peptidyl-prolyl cis-trans isomerase C
MSDNARVPFSYPLLRASLLHFGKAPSQLDDHALKVVQAQAQREYTIEQRILASPEASTIQITEYEINQGLRKIEARYQKPEAMVHDMEEYGIDYQDLRHAVMCELKVEAILKHISAQATAVSDLDVQLTYHLHLEQFRRQELRIARHILLTINPEFTQNVRSVAKQRISEIAKRLLHKPHRFAEQALKHSECPTAMNGGLLGAVPKGQLYPQLDKVLFTLKTGEISSPVESSLGFHLLHCESIQVARLIPFKEAAPVIRNRLEERAKRQYQRSWLKSLNPKRTLV